MRWKRRPRLPSTSLPVDLLVDLATFDPDELRNRSMIANKFSHFIDDFPIDRAFYDDVATRLDRQTAFEIPANMQGTVPLHNCVVEDRAIDIREATDQKWPFHNFLCRKHSAIEEVGWVPTEPDSGGCLRFSGRPCKTGAEANAQYAQGFPVTMR